jgi:cytochrome P450
VEKVMAAPEATFHQADHPTIFHEILNSKLPAHEKTSKRLAQEAATITGAATHSTAWALSVGAFYILSSPIILKTLRQELITAIPNPDEMISVAELMKLEYLAGCVQEMLRMSYGTSIRLQRIATAEDMVFIDTKTDKHWTIPRGTPTGMSAALLHHDESIFPNSYTFSPERWLAKEQRERIAPFMVAFGRGARNCLGMNLASAELYLLVATLFRNFGIQDDDLGQKIGNLALFETEKRDVLMAQDLQVAIPWEGTQGIRVLVLD